jgi:hypothetical protein
MKRLRQNYRYTLLYAVQKNAIRRTPIVLTIAIRCTPKPQCLHYFFAKYISIFQVMGKSKLALVLSSYLTHKKLANNRVNTVFKVCTILFAVQ